MATSMNMNRAGMNLQNGKTTAGGNAPQQSDVCLQHLDPGSMASFVTERIACPFQLPKLKQTIGISGIAASPAVIPI